MSKQIQTQTSEDIYDTCKQNVEKYFENAESTVPQYFQSLTSIQVECYKACNNAIASAISLQQEFAKKTGIFTEIPESVRKGIVDTGKQINKVKSVQNQIVQATTNSVLQNIKTWNDSASAFTDLNRNILQSWISTFTQTRN
ncbi:MAG: hypothetical protein OEM28_11905 [Nitrosopumilus sp.]|nr:hypothetical protein [Nitrosopumilus sp.]MDH3487156.1 hypothetical protein [Nitrosopumilus sp.]